MLVYFNKKGIVKEQIDSYGNLPRVGTEYFKIIAYFEDVDLNSTAAYIILQKPDFSESEYPALFMQQINLNYSTSASPTVSNYFSVDDNPYPCYMFDFTSVKDANNQPINLLTMPGLWRAVITVIDAATNATNVVGTVTFNVGGSAPDETEVALDYDDVTRNYAGALAQKMGIISPYYMRVWENFEEDADEGELTAAYFPVGVVVFDPEAGKYYSVDGTAPNQEDETKVYADYSILPSFVPYSGATHDVDLGEHKIRAKKVELEDSDHYFNLLENDLFIVSENGKISLRSSGDLTHNGLRVMRETDIPSFQATLAMIKNPLMNINDWLLSNYESELVFVGTYPAYKITRGGEVLTEETAKTYMKAMTGSEYLPVFNFRNPQNSFLVTSDGELLKPQFDETNGLLLYKVTKVATQAWVDEHVNGHFAKFVETDTGYAILNGTYVYTLKPASKNNYDFVIPSDIPEGYIACVNFETANIGGLLNIGIHNNSALDMYIFIDGREIPLEEVPAVMPKNSVVEGLIEYNGFDLRFMFKSVQKS